MRHRLALAVPAAALLAVTLGLPGAAANPPGNNGTVKVDAEPMDTLPDNQPHAGCVFQVDFYGFDAGSLWATATFAVMTDGDDIPVLTSDPVFIGEDSNAGGGSVTGIDREVTFDLNERLYAFDTNPQQGVHVRLTVHADGASNADTKTKTFWATGCHHEDQPT